MGLGDLAKIAVPVVAALLAVLSGRHGLGALHPEALGASRSRSRSPRLGLLVCPFTLASATTLIYMLRPSTRAAFRPPKPGRPPTRPR